MYIDLVEIQFYPLEREREEEKGRRKMGRKILCVLVTSSYLTLCDPIDLSPPGSSVHGISQARINTAVGCHFLLQERFYLPPNLYIEALTPAAWNLTVFRDRAFKEMIKII